MEVLKEIGSGGEAVYVYYFPRDKQAGRERWPHKIGRAKNDPKERIRVQQASMQEEPIIALLVHCDDSIFTEAYLHAAFADQKLDSFGREWFEVNATEIENALPGKLSDLQLSHQVRAIRRARGLSQTELAERVGLRQATISAIENGGPIKLATYKSVIDELGLKIVLMEK